MLAPHPGLEPTPPALEGEVLTTGPPGKTPSTLFLAAAPKVCSRNPCWVEPFEGICEVKIIFLVILACYLLSCCHPLRIAQGNFRDI